MFTKKLLTFCIISVILLITGCSPRQEQKDIADTSILKNAEELGKSCPYFRCTVSPLTSASEEITVQYENTGDTHLIYADEIQIDRLIGDTWYFWGESGNSLEYATGVLPGDTVTEVYPLSVNKMEEGDFFAPYDGVSINGQYLTGKEKQTRIVLFPGTYRMRTQVEEPRNSNIQNEAQKKFENTVEVNVEK